MEDVMTSCSNSDLAKMFLTEEQLSNYPILFRNTPTNSKVSSKYVPVETIRIIRDLEKYNWKPVEVKTRKHRLPNPRFTIHMVTFQNPDITIDGKDLLFPRIILTNSYDGFSSFKFMVGLYRFVCSNGLILGETYERHSAVHMEYDTNLLEDKLNSALSALPEKIEIISEMKNTHLSYNQMLELGQIAYNLRTGQDSTDNSTILQMLTPVREEDRGDDLFTVFNVLQEKIINGGFTYQKDIMKKPRMMKKIKSFEKDLHINKMFFEAARNFIDNE